jgi:hypothetical protein
LSVVVSEAGFFDTIKDRFGISTKETVDDDMVASGLKEALSMGTQNAVKWVSQVDGYFGREMIKILMPERLGKVAEVLGKMGFQRQIDDFILSMNRAAEQAAPKAASIFGEAIRDMTLDDARSILDGGDTAATDYFRTKTSDGIYEQFKPVISSSMNDVGVTRSYKALMDQYASLPFMEAQWMDLDDYVTKKAMDGLFYMLGQEEIKIRTDPASRVTDLLKKVFAP